MLQIKVFQNGSNRIYNTNTFKEGESKREFYNFLNTITNVDIGNKKLIGFEDAVTDTKVFVSPALCLIEVEEATNE